MHLDSLKIKNFRILEDVTIEKLGHVNLIVGKNNSGKSTVLEALALLAGRGHPIVFTELAKRRSGLKINEVTRQEFNIDFERFFSHRKSSNQYPVIFIGNDSFFCSCEFVYINSSETNQINNNNYSITHEIELLKPSDLTDSKFLTTELQSGIQIKTDVGEMIINNNTFKSHISSNYVIALLKPFVEDIAQLAFHWDNIVFTEYENILLQALKLIDADIEGLTFSADGYNDKFKSANDFSSSRIPYVKLRGVQGKVPLYSMGDGVLRLLEIFLAVSSTKNGFLLIDEFENGLHYSVQPKVWELIFELAHRFNIQVFATTHSWDCIESFAQVAKDRTDMEGVLFRMGHSVRKSDNGKLIATVFNEDDLYNLTKMQMEVR